MTYSSNEDVEHRLDTGEYKDLVVDTITNCRERAFRDIKEVFVKNGKEHPDPNGEDVGVLKDAEADLASYYYRRDRAEYDSREEGVKEFMWKKDAYDKVERYISARYGNVSFRGGSS